MCVQSNAQLQLIWSYCLQTNVCLSLHPGDSSLYGLSRDKSKAEYLADNTIDYSYPVSSVRMYNEQFG